MTRQEAKEIALSHCRPVILTEGYIYAPYIPFYVTRDIPWHKRFSSRLAILHHGAMIFVSVTMSIFLQVADKNPQGLHLSDVNWFYVAAATLAGTVMAVRSYNKCFDTRPA